MFSFKMLPILSIFLLFCSAYGDIYYDGSPQSTISECMSTDTCRQINVVNLCYGNLKMNDPKCIMDISGLSQNEFSNLLKKINALNPWIMCNGSALSEINFSNSYVGHWVLKAKEDLKGNEPHGTSIELEEYTTPTLTVVNNLNLKKVTLNQDLGKLLPGLLKIRNNPRLSRSSIGSIWNLLKDDPKIKNKAVIQPYGECDFHTYMNPKKDSLSWEEFRWCRNVVHSVLLEGPKFNDTIVDAAYILEVQGALTISDTKLTDLRILPVYFKINSGVISNNLHLCISFEDEIRMKRLGFTMEKNKPLDCRTNCQGGKLSLDKVRSLKNCLTIKGGLELENVDATAAAADLFKTVKRIEGPLVIRKAQVPVVFKKLETIQLTATTDQPHIRIENCTHPIVFNKRVKLEGYSTSPHMVVLKDAKANIYKHLKTTYIGKVYDSVRDQLKITTVAANAAPSVNVRVTPTIEKPEGAPATPVAMPVATNSENAEGITATPVMMPDAEENDVPPAERRSSRLPSGAYPPPGTNAAEISDANSYRGDLDNSSVDNKKTVLVVMTCASFVIFLASSVTSVGILLKFSIM